MGNLYSLDFPIYLNKDDRQNSSEEFYIIKNLQELKSLIRKFLS